VVVLTGVVGEGLADPHRVVSIAVEHAQHVFLLGDERRQSASWTVRTGLVEET
jgi:hypothetical protein